MAKTSYHIEIDLNYSQFIEAVVEIDFIRINKNWLNLKGYHVVYFLLKDDFLLYIGCTSDVATRLSAHKTCKEFNKLILIQCNERTNAFKIEKYFIKKYKPHYNCTERIYFKTRKHETNN
jgi:predicted GIY-YIG superfamily endonuclease